MLNEETVPLLSLVDRALRFPRSDWKECPNGCSLIGDPIPQEWQERGYFKGTHWSRVEGVYVASPAAGFSIPTSGPAYLRCPDCKVTWHLFEEGTVERYAVQQVWGECYHVDTWFDRAICPEPCGAMHTVCVDCSEILGGCPLISSEDVKGR